MKKILSLLILSISLHAFSQTSKPQWASYYSRTDVQCIIPDGNSLWLGTNLGGIYQSDLNGNVLQSFTKDNGLPDNRIRCNAIDSQGNKWFGTWGGVLKYDGKTWTNYSSPEGGKNNYIESIAIDAQGNKWFGTAGGGVSKFDGATWTTYNTANGLAGYFVYSIAIDAEGNKWFGTGGGLKNLMA
jgi:ligand-binding sensor domain-containing protein